MSNPNTTPEFGFRGDNPEFVKKIARKYKLSTDGITSIQYVADLIQLEARFKSKLHEVHPGARVMWSKVHNRLVCEFFTNDDLDIFGFAKVILPPKEGDEYGDVIMVPFHMVDPIMRIQELF